MAEMFVGRQTEIDAFSKAVADPAGQAILVVGHWGMGKTALLEKFQAVAPAIPGLKCFSLRYEVAKTDPVDQTMALILDNAIEAAQVREGSFDGTPRRVRQWGALLNCLGPIGDLVESLRYKPEACIRDQFVDRLRLISERMPSDHRLLILVDPEKEMQADSDQAWSIVAAKLPPKIKLVFAQRPEDVLATSGQFLANPNVIRIPGQVLGGLGEEAIGQLVDDYAGKVACAPAVLRDAVGRFGGHPYATVAALELIKDGLCVDRLPQDPRPVRIIEEQWRRVRLKGQDAIRLLEAHACVGMPLSDGMAENVSGITRESHMGLTADPFLGGLLRDAVGARQIYHNVLSEYIARQCDQTSGERYIERAISEWLSAGTLGFFDKVKLIELWQEQDHYTDELLDRFLHLLQSNDGIKRYMAQHVHSGRLVKRLHEKGVFATTPEPVETGSGITFPFWLDGAMLIKVADQIPQVVSEVAKGTRTSNPHNYAILLEAIQKIPPPAIKDLWPTTVRWLEQGDWLWLPDEYCGLAQGLVQNGDLELVRDFLKVVLQPLPPRRREQATSVPRHDEAAGRLNGGPSAQSIAEQVRLFLRHDEATGRFTYDDLDRHVRPLVTAIEVRQPGACIPLLEQLLCEAIELECHASGSEFPKTGGWRQAIEDHDQNGLPREHKDLLLVLLRDALEKYSVNCPDDSWTYMGRYLYLAHEWPLFRRIAIHVPEVVKHFETVPLGN